MHAGLPELDARLRPDAISFYYHGRSLALIKGRRRGPAKLSVHHKYLADDRIGDYVGGRNGKYRTFDVDAAFAEVYASRVHSLLVERARGHLRSEETVESRLLECNNEAGPVCCFDRGLLDLVQECAIELGKTRIVQTIDMA